MICTYQWPCLYTNLCHVCKTSKYLLTSMSTSFQSFADARWTPALRGVLVSVPSAPSSSFAHRCTHARECYSVDVDESVRVPVVYARTTRSGVLHICGRSTGGARGTVLLYYCPTPHVTNHPRPSPSFDLSTRYPRAIKTRT